MILIRFGFIFPTSIEGIDIYLIQDQCRSTDNSVYDLVQDMDLDPGLDLEQFTSFGF